MHAQNFAHQHIAQSTPAGQHTSVHSPIWPGLYIGLSWWLRSSGAAGLSPAAVCTRDCARTAPHHRTNGRMHACSSSNTTTLEVLVWKAHVTPTVTHRARRHTPAHSHTAWTLPTLLCATPAQPPAATNNLNLPKAPPARTNTHKRLPTRAALTFAAPRTSSG